MIDNPQLEINGNPAWHINLGHNTMISPFYGKPMRGDHAVTIEGLFVNVGTSAEPDWLPKHDRGFAIGPSMLKLMLSAKGGWDNQRKMMLGRIGSLEVALKAAIDDLTSLNEMMQRYSGTTLGSMQTEAHIADYKKILMDEEVQNG